MAREHLKTSARWLSSLFDKCTSKVQLARKDFQGSNLRDSPLTLSLTNKAILCMSWSVIPRLSWEQGKTTFSYLAQAPVSLVPSDFSKLRTRHLSHATIPKCNVHQEENHRVATLSSLLARERWEDSFKLVRWPHQIATQRKHQIPLGNPYSNKYDNAIFNWNEVHFPKNIPLQCLQEYQKLCANWSKHH